MIFQDIENLLVKIGFVKEKKSLLIQYNYLQYRLNAHDYGTSSEMRLICAEEFKPGKWRAKVLHLIRKSTSLDSNDCEEAYNKLRTIFKHEYRKLVIDSL